MYTVGSAQTAHIKSFIIHSLDDADVNEKFMLFLTAAETLVQQHLVIRLLDWVFLEDTYFFECAYPICRHQMVIPFKL